MSRTPGDGLRVSVMMPHTVKDSAASVAEFARHVEAVGLDGVFAGDHLAPAGPQPDTTLVLTVAATVTQRVALGFGVMVLALRGPAWAAKQVATLQILSGGRVVLGVGAGGDVHGTEAWEAVGVPYGDRGALTDAALRVLPDLVTGHEATLGSGARLTLSPAASMPPVWVGGLGAVARRRAVAFGTAWFPSMMVADRVRAGRVRLAELAADTGRPVPRLALGAAAAVGDVSAEFRTEFARGLVTGYRVPDAEAEHVLVSGDAADIAARIAEYAEVGVEHLVVGLVGDDWRTACEVLAEARDLVRPAATARRGSPRDRSPSRTDRSPAGPGPRR